MQIHTEQGVEDNNINGADNITNIIEAVLFASGEPVSFTEIAAVLGIAASEIREIIVEFAKNYNLRNTGLEIIVIEDNAQLIARAENIEYIRKVLKSEVRQSRVLSKPALEILAIIAYNQPVTRNYMEQIRGVDCSYMLGNLIERGYIEEKGILEVPGRPRLYGTTIKFLAQFGLTDISGLPEIEKFKDTNIDVVSSAEDE